MDLLNLQTKLISTYAISAFDDFIFLILIFFCWSTCECLIFSKEFPRQFRLFFGVTLLAFTSWDFERKLMYFFLSKMKPELTLTVHKGEFLCIHLNLQVKSETGKTGTLSPRMSAMMPWSRRKCRTSTSTSNLFTKSNRFHIIMKKSIIIFKKI